MRTCNEHREDTDLELLVTVGPWTLLKAPGLER